MFTKRMKNIGRGVYLVEHFDLAQETWCAAGELYGSLASAFAEMEALAKANTWDDVRLMYLKVGVDQRLTWHPVDMEGYEHYHGAQQRYLQHLLFVTDSPMSNLGFHRLASLVDLSESRIKDALRKPDSEKYRPLSQPALLYIQHKIEQTEYADRVLPDYKDPALIEPILQ